MTSFKNLPLPEELQTALAALNFTHATKTQEKVTPPLLEGHDVMVCAETGSGKTAAYGIPMVNKLLAEPQSTALVLAPTRELVHQISDFMRELTSHCRKLKVTSLVGGADMRKQLQALKKKPQMIIATPGRLIDHLKRGSLKLATTRFLVLDEGDRMLDMGFAPQLDEIIKHLPKERQSSLFTATLPLKVQKLAETYLVNPQKVLLSQDSLPVDTIKQSVLQVPFKEKDDRLVDELNRREGSVIVFARTKHRTDIIADYLREYGFAVGLIHGGRTQGQRNKAIHDFRSGRSRILCATDIAARGIDVPQVEHVINYDLPMMIEDYVHRIGRTARNGASGEAVSFVQPEEHRTWQLLVRRYKIVGADLPHVPGSRLGGRPSDRFGGKKKFGKGRKPAASQKQSNRKEKEFFEFGFDFEAGSKKPSKKKTWQKSGEKTPAKTGKKFSKAKNDKFTGGGKKKFRGKKTGGTGRRVAGRA